MSEPNQAPVQIGSYKIKVHPVAAMFPMIPEGSRDWKDLLGSLENAGQVDAIVLDGDVLLDGRNRLKACEQLGIQPIFTQWRELKTTLNLPANLTVCEWIQAKNFDRRNLTESQKVSIAAEIGAWEIQEINREQQRKSQFQNSGKSAVTQKPESPSEHDRNARSTAGQIAAIAGVSRYKAEQALKVKKESPELHEKVKAGKLSLTEAVRELPSNQAPEYTRRKRRDKTVKSLNAAWKGSNRDARTRFLEWLLENLDTYPHEKITIVNYAINYQSARDKAA